MTKPYTFIYIFSSEDVDEGCMQLQPLADKTKNRVLQMIKTTILIMLFVFAIACNNNTAALTPKQSADTQDSVRLMAESISKDVSHDGPVAWLRYFENTPGFFMASDGQLAFPNFDSARNFINNALVKSISKIELRWSDIRVDPVTTDLASISAVFHEDITDAAGKTTPHDGYFTGIAHQTDHGWKLHNAHWSGIATH